ncbi:VpaChn25_0724 family phage protein [Phenylobacterium ferrooxidans]|uniref:ArsR family transcriptional regulator n=1 Tax=Phenylobacterium ferrooxidans TaxID=2982689 RepID=A0ABW6CND9_9CAUL
MNYAAHFSEHLRLAILKVLNTAPACRANSSILHSAVDELGLTATRDQVKTELAWLAEQRLLTNVAAGDLVVATLTERGCDVADGRTVTPGVRRPTPRG